MLITAALGVWLMFAPALFGTEGTAANSNHLVGALIVTISVIVMAVVIRAGRFLNVLMGAWIIAAMAACRCLKWRENKYLIIGALVVLLSLPRGRIKERYAGWDRFVI